MQRPTGITIMWHRLALIAAIVASTAGVAHADTYPVSGTWTYDNASAKGPAKECGQKVMRFQGNIRRDTGTSVPEYKNISIDKRGATTWYVIDDFYTLQIRGRMIYTLRLIDEDHIEIELEKGGKTFLLRRCE
jgi:hypothetical protein